MQLFIRTCLSTKHEIPLEAGSALIALLLSAENWLWLWAPCSVSTVGVMFVAGHPGGTGYFEPVFSEVDRLYSSILYRTWLRASSRSCVLLLWPQGINFSLFLLSLECLRRPTWVMKSSMKSRIVCWMAWGYIHWEWEACWEVVNRLGRAEGVALGAVLPVLALGTVPGVQCSQNCAQALSSEKLFGAV